MSIEIPLRPHINTFGRRAKISPATGPDFEILAVIDRSRIDTGEVRGERITILIHHDDIKNRGVLEKAGVTLYDKAVAGEAFVIRDIDRDDLPAVNIVLSIA